MGDWIGSSDPVKRKIAQLEEKIQYMQRLQKLLRNYLSEGVYLNEMRRRSEDDDEVYVKYCSKFFYEYKLIYYLLKYFFLFQFPRLYFHPSMLKTRNPPY